jgi:hypothetical protein
MPAPNVSSRRTPRRRINQRGAPAKSEGSGAGGRGSGRLLDGRGLRRRLLAAWATDELEDGGASDHARDRDRGGGGEAGAHRRCGYRFAPTARLVPAVMELLKDEVGFARCESLRIEKAIQLVEVNLPPCLGRAYELAEPIALQERVEIERRAFRSLSAGHLTSDGRSGSLEGIEAKEACQQRLRPRKRANRPAIGLVTPDVFFRIDRYAPRSPQQTKARFLAQQNRQRLFSHHAKTKGCDPSSADPARAGV